VLEKVGIKCDTELQKNKTKVSKMENEFSLFFVIYCVYLEDAFLFYKMFYGKIMFKRYGYYWKKLLFFVDMCHVELVKDCTVPHIS